LGEEIEMYTLSHILRQTKGTNNRKVADDISIRYQYGGGEEPNPSNEE
jgi:hypothetical protein